MIILKSGDQIGNSCHTETVLGGIEPGPAALQASALSISPYALGTPQQDMIFQA